MVLASDDEHTYIYYRYYNVEWKTSTSFRVQAGYSFNLGPEYHSEIINPDIPSSIGDSLAFHKVTGNTNQTGNSGLTLFNILYAMSFDTSSSQVRGVT